MLNAELTSRLKEVTKEDILIARLLTTLIGELDRPLEVLDVGGGDGSIAKRVLAAYPNSRIALVEPDKQATTPPPQGIYLLPSDIRDAKLGWEYNLIILSHVLGHIVPPGSRRELLTSLYRRTVEPRTLMIVTNALVDTFGLFQTEIWRLCSDFTYRIDLAHVAMALPEVVGVGKFTVKSKPIKKTELEQVAQAFSPVSLPTKITAGLSDHMESFKVSSDSYILEIPQFVLSFGQLGEVERHLSFRIPSSQLEDLSHQDLWDQCPDLTSLLR